MFGNLFRKETEAERYLFKELGRRDRLMNQIIRSIPELSDKIYETVRMLLDQNLRRVVEDYGARVNEPDVYKKIDSEKLRKVELELINYILFYVAGEVSNVVSNPDHLDILIHGINLGLRKYFFIPEEQFLRYSKLMDSRFSEQDLNNKFTIALASYLIGKTDAKIASEFSCLCPVIKKASKILVEMKVLSHLE